MIAEDDLGSGSFDLSFQGDTTGANLDNSWLFNFETNGVSYTVTHRSTEYLFESQSRNKFYFDPSAKVVDPQTGYAIKDKIRVSKTNSDSNFTSSLTYDYDWQIVDNVTGDDGYNDTRKIKVGFFDSDDDGVVDNPDLFTTIVDPDTNKNDKFVFFQSVTVEGFDQLNVVDQTDFLVVEQESDIDDFSVYPDNQLFYFWGNNTFKQYDATTDTTTTVTGYTAKPGRQDLVYNYNHGAIRSRRIDPSVSNIVDVYAITKTYDQALRTWLRNNQSTIKPDAPTIFDLEDQYLASLNGIKSISDEIIFNPGEYKMLFGPGADANLQAQFKVVKNPSSAVSDNQIKSQVIAAIDTYFQLDFWDFGDTFYFTELAAYVHNQLAPDLLSVVIVPAQSTSGFGSLFQVFAEDNEIFISSATVDNVEIINTLSAEKLKATGTVVTSADVATTSTSTVTATVATSSSSGTSSSSSSGGYY